MAKKNKAAKFEGMTEDQILAKAKELADRYENTPEQDRPQAFYDFGNKAVEINRARRAARGKARSAKETAFNAGLATTWKVPEALKRTRNRIAALIMQESGPRADATPEYTLLGERLVASALKNYMTKYGLTSSELISGKGRYGGANYLSSITDVQQNPKQSVYDWANDTFNLTKFVQDDTTFNHMTNAVRLASALVNGTLRPLTSATNFKHLDPDDKFEGMTEVGYDFGAITTPSNRVLKLYTDPKLRRTTRQDAEGGDTPGTSEETTVSETPVSEAPQDPGSPRIVINPQVFRDKRDALCVAFNEAFRLVMEENAFEPVSEPTEKQRKFFADTAYANDELQLRRTILARIATLDTSVSDPTDEQLEETAEMLEMVMEVGAPQNEWEQQAVQRLHDVVAKAREGHVQNEETPPPPQDEASVQADVGGAFTPSEVLLPKEPDDVGDLLLRNAVRQSVEAYRRHAGERPEDAALLPPVYSDDPKDYRQYVADLAVHAAGTPGAEDVRRRLAAGGSVAYRYLTRPGLRTDDGRSVTTIPENHLLNLPAKFYAGATASLSGMARALKAGSSDAARVVRGPENLGSAMYEGSVADRLADRLEAMSRRFDARVTDAHPALGIVFAAGGIAPWFAARDATVPLMMASAMESGRLDYDRAWMATGENPYDAASWWRTPTARAAVLGAVGTAPWGPWLRQGVQRARLAAAPVAERAVVPYSPLSAAPFAAPQLPGGAVRAVDAAAGIGAFTAADLLWPAVGGKPLPPPR